LELCGKTMEDMNIDIGFSNKAWEGFYSEFSYPNFFYYLLSPEFIEKYDKKIYPNETKYSYPWFFYWYVERFWIAIYEHQSWSSEYLIDLLSEIWQKKWLVADVVNYSNQK
jgi:hypothetical protein